MDTLEIQERVKEAKRRAKDRWADILLACGVADSIVARRDQPCPLCGGKDRFRFTDKNGEGGYYCHKCGPGDPFKLLQGVCGLDFLAALKRVESCVGSLPPQAQPVNRPTPERMKQLARRIWEEASPVAQGDPVDRYLRQRGLALAAYPGSLRCHPALGYYQSKPDAKRPTKVAEFPAMLARVQGQDGRAITLHRTYLEDGRKASLPDAKKLLSTGVNGAAVRLFEVGEEVAVTEGIETALAVHLSTGKPVWSALSAGNMEKLWLPPTVRGVCIYADNDADAEFDGQASAYVLARRLKRDEAKTGPRDVSVFVPKQPGHDWADVRLARLANERQAA